MENGQIYIIVALAFYFLLLLYHVWDSKRISSTLDSYALSTEKYSSFIIAVVMAVTMIGPADALALSQNGLKYGLIWAIFPIGAALAQLITGKFFASKLNSQFSGLITVGEIFEKRSSQYSSLAVGFVTFLQAVAFSGVLILAGGQVLETFLGLNKALGMMITTVFVGGYTSFGGMTAVMKTDKVQGVFMGVMIVLLIIACTAMLLGSTAVKDSILIKSDFVKDYDLRLIFTLFFGYLLGELLLPTYCMRAMISKDNVAASKGFYKASLILIIWYILITFSGSIGASILTVDRTSPNDLILLDVLRYFVPKGGFLWNIVGAGVFLVLISLIHSTFDSFLNTGAISISKDFFGKILKLSNEQVLWLSKQATIGISALGLIIAIWKNDLIDILFIGYTVWVPSILAPFVWILYNPDKKLKSYSFWGGLAVGSLSWFVFEYWLPFFIPATIMGLFLNSITILFLQRFLKTN